MDRLTLRVAALFQSAYESEKEEILENAKTEAQDVLKGLLKNDSALTELLRYLEKCQRLLRSDDLRDTLEETEKFHRYNKEGIDQLKRALREDDLVAFRRGVLGASQTLARGEEHYKVLFLEEQLWESPVCMRLVDKTSSNEDAAGTLKDLSEWGSWT